MNRGRNWILESAILDVAKQIDTSVALVNPAWSQKKRWILLSLIN